MVDYSNSPLKDPQFMNRSAGDVLADRLSDSNNIRQAAVARRQGNERALSEEDKILFGNMTYGEIVSQYGQDTADSVAKSGARLTTEIGQQQGVLDAERSGSEIASDTAIGVASGFVNTVGSMSAVAMDNAAEVSIPMRLADKLLSNFEGYNDVREVRDQALSRMAVDQVDSARRTTEFMKGFQSQELRERQNLSTAERELDAQDNLDEYNRRTNDGSDADFIDDLAWMGRGTINNLGRIGSDAALTGDVVAEGIGSLGPSAKLASFASRAVTQTSSYQAAKIANAIAPTQGTRFLAMGAEAVNRGAIAASVGVSEASGVYSQTVNEVLGMTHGSLMETSEEYRKMIESDVDPDDAKTTLAANAGMDSFVKAFPMAASLGVIAGKFEAMPLSSFRGQGFIGGLRQVGTQTLEEGGQGFTGQIATNTAIRDTGVDPEREPSKGVDEALATGMIAGTGMAGVMAAPSVFRRPNVERTSESREQVQQRIEAAKASDDYTRKQYDMADNVVQSRMAFLEGKTDPMTEAELNEYEFLLDNSYDSALVAEAYGLVNKKDQRPAPAVPTPSGGQSPAGKAVSALASAAATGLDGVQAVGSAAVNTRAGQAAIAGTKAVASKVGAVAAPAVEAGTAAVTEFNARPNRKDQVRTLATISEVSSLSDGDTTSNQGVQAIARNEASGSVPATFANTTTGKTTLARVGGIVSKLSEKGVRINKMSDSDVLYAASEMQNLRNAIPNLPTAMRTKVKDIIASEDFKNIQKRATRIDLFKTQDETKTITDDMVQETKLVAALNPANINPVVAGKVLEQDDRTDLTDQDINNLKTAKRIGEAIKSRSEAYVEAQVKENVELSVKPEYRDGKKQTKPVDLVEAISRNIFLGSGDTRAPSVGQFASQIMQGAQNPDGTVEIDGIPTDVNQVTDHFTNFAIHMVNKVGALNTSYANRDANGNGTAESFDNLGPNRKIRSGRTENGAVQGKAVTYQGASPGGIRFAGELYADAVAAVEVYNALAEAFPERFPAGQLSVPEFAPNVTQSDLSNEGDAQTEVDPVETEAAPTAVEEVSAPAETDEQDAEVTPPTLAEMMAAETRTKDDFSAMTYEQLIESANRWFVEEEGMGLEAMPEARQTVIKEYTDSIIAYFNLPPNLVTGITWLRTPDAGHMGQAMWGERLIAMRAGAVRALLGSNETEAFRTAEHTVFHELMHIIDAYASNDVTRPASHSSKLFDKITGEEGAIYKEVMAAVESDPEMKAYFDYALSYNNIDTLDALASEIFAEIGALYLEETDKARQLFPEGVKYVESIIEQAGGTIVGETTDGSATQESQGDEAVLGQTSSVADKTFDNVSPKFNDSFLKRKGDFQYGDGDGILSMVEAQPGTENYVEFVRLYKDRIMTEANNRLATLKVNKSKKDELPIKDRIIAGDEEVGLYRRNKNTIAVDRTTGEYDPDLLSIAAVAVLDWLTGARSQNIKNLDEILEDMNLSYDMVTDEQINSIMNGINPRDAAESLAKDIVRMWGLRINTSAPMVDARGAAEGMAKELLEALLTVSDQEVAANRQPLLNRKTVPYVDPENVEAQRQKALDEGKNPDEVKIFPVDQIIFDVSVMREFQQAIGLVGQEAAKKTLAPELDTMPSIGASARSIDDTQSRGDVKLSRREKKTLERMQNQGHGLNVVMSDMVGVIGSDVLGKFLGNKDFSELDERHPLRASIAGKNLSIERDYQEAMMVINGVKNAGFTVNGELPKVFYRVGISRVGRHQFKGINPQGNKILRALVTPTKSLLNMDNKRHKDAFWLTVAQAADISGFNKVESQPHKFLLENIQEQFYAKYAEAVEMVGEYLEGGDLDGAALVAAMGGSGEMQQLAAVFAVAQMEKALSDGTNTFETTLSFELDGKTDGPGNMMANFGQGILTEQDYMNFKRVGFFLGTKGMTLNKFFGDKTQRDLYEVTSLKGQMALHNAIANGSYTDKAKFHAIANLASAFGDLKIENKQFVLTRNASKNPMTKTVYGSSERGIGVGLAQDMMLKMYQALIDNPDGIVDYPGGKEGFEKDFSTAFGMNFPKGRNWKKDYLGQNEVDNFTKTVTQTLGKVLSDTAKEVIGDEITKVSDTLVLMTAFQTEFLTAKFKELLDAKVAERVADGSISTNKTTGTPDRSSLTQADYDAVVAQIRAYSPTYANGMQTLDIGSLSATNSGIKLSESMSNTFQAPSTMVSPELAGVKVIPYITQGRGDAMMMNWIYGGETAPVDTLQVFDGIDMPIDKIFEYAQQINSAVLQNWEADVIGDIVNDVTGFLDKTANDGDLLLGAWDRAYSNALKKKTTATAKTPQELIEDVLEMQRRNQARKAVFKKIGISVDHMGGSDTAFTQGPDGREWSLGEINDLIRIELGERAPQNQNDQTVNPDGSIDGEFTEINLDAFQVEDQRAPVEGEFSKLVITDAATVMDGLLRETRNKPVAAAVRILQKANLQTRIVIGSPEEVSAWYSENIGDMNSGLKQDKKGIYDPVNDVMLITDNNHETLVHELIHAATFQIIENFHNGDQTHKDTIGRLETLSQEFMDMDFSKSSKEVQDSANSAKAQILVLQVKDDAFSKAAALNEFMAWTLSNEGLMKELGQKQTSVMARMTKVLKALMQRMLGGVKSDMLSNIQFNTELLITTPPEPLALPAPVEDTLDELTPGAQKMTNFWIDLAKQRLEEARNSTGRVSEKLAQISDYRKNAQSALDTLTFGGFTLSAYQRETFKAIHMVLALEMRLDPQSSAALNEMFKHVTDNLTPAMFGPTNEQDRYSAVMEIFGGTKNDEGVSDAIAVLLALSQTSRGFRAAIDQLSVPQSLEGVSTDSVNDFLSSVTGMLMNKAIGSIDLSGQSVSETLDQLSESILLEESEKEFRILARLMQNLDKADEWGKGGFKKLAGYTEAVNDELRASNRSQLTKLTFGAITAATAFMDQDRAEIQAEALKRVTHMGTNLDFAVFAREFISEVIGTDKTNAKVTAMLDEVTYAASSVRQNYREDLPVIFQQEFATHPNAAQWKATHKVLGKTEFAAVYDQDRPNTSFEFFKDENLIDDEILVQEAAIRGNFSSPVANVILEKAQQLADFNNDKGPGHQLWRNAHAINTLAGEYKSSMTAEIDKLITFYAMKGSDPAMRQEITRMYENDPVAMQNLAVYMQALNKEEDSKFVSEEALMNGFKGYVPDLGQQGTKVIIAKDEDKRDLEKKGYKRIGDASADSGFSSVNRGYYVTSTKQTGTYSQGVMQIIQDTYRGVDATTGLSVNGMTSGVITGAAVASVTNWLNSLTGGLADNKEAFLPVYAADGVLHYERFINPDVLEKYTAPKSNLALMLGAWAGRQVEEKIAQKYNAALIDQLKRTYDERESEDDSLYVNLPELAKAQKEWDEATVAERRLLKQPDRVYVESWKVISPQTKRYIEEVFGKDNFFVRKDQMNIALGYRDPSVIDLWTGNTRMPAAVREGVQAITGLVMGDKAMRNLAATEGAVQGVVSTAKDLIVVRSLVVPYMNTQANVVQLSTRGIPVKQQFKGYKNKLAEIEKFNLNVKEIMRLDTRIQLAGTDANKVRILEGQKQVILDENKRMSVAPLIEAGAYKNISEGLTDMDVEITSGRIGDWVEKQTNKLPAGVQTVAKYGLLSKDTALYKGANKAVQYGDFIAKSIYYDHLIDKGLSQEDAMKLVNEEFVNFSVLPGRTRQYLEGVGATWFLAFKIRIMKIAMNQIRENPARSLILAATIADYGSPQADNLASVIADDRIGYALGWEMMFNAAGLNPWVNIVE